MPSVRRVSTLVGALTALTIMGSSAVAVALPGLAADLELDTSGTAWVMASFSLAFSIATAFFGRLADLKGLRMPMRVGAVLFAAGSLLAAAAVSFPMLIAGRLLAGAGGGAVPVLSMGIVAARFPGAARSKALGALAAVVTIVSGSGPLIAGSIAEVLSWRGVLGLPAVALLLVGPVARVAPDTAPAGGRLDVKGALLVAATVSAFTLFLQSPSMDLGLAVSGGTALASVAGVLLLMRRIRLRPAGFLPAVVATNPIVIRSGIAGASLIASYVGMLLAVPLLLSAEQGWGPFQIGLAVLPAAVVGAVGSRMVGGRLRPGGHRQLATRFVALTPLGLLLASFVHTVPVLLIAALALVMLGFSAGQVVLLDRVSSAARDEVRGVALGVYHLIFFVGAAVGAAMVGGLSGPLSLPAALAVLAVVPCAGALAAAGSADLRHGGEE